MQKIKLTDLLYADNIEIIADTDKNLQYNLNTLYKELKKINKKVDVKKL